MDPPQSILGLSHRYTGKVFKNLSLQKYLPQMLEIRCIALPSGSLPYLFKSRSQGSKWPRASGRGGRGGSYVRTIEIHRKIFKNLHLQNHLAKMLEILY